MTMRAERRDLKSGIKKAAIYGGIALFLVFALFPIFWIFLTSI